MATLLYVLIGIVKTIFSYISNSLSNIDFASINPSLVIGVLLAAVTIGWVLKKLVQIAAYILIGFLAIGLMIKGVSLLTAL